MSISRSRRLNAELARRLEPRASLPLHRLAGDRAIEFGEHPGTGAGRACDSRAQRSRNSCDSFCGARCRSARVLDTCYLDCRTGSRRSFPIGSRTPSRCAEARSWIESERLAVARSMIRDSERGCVAKDLRQRQFSVFSKWPWRARGSTNEPMSLSIRRNFEILAGEQLEFGLHG